jgi:hypothetical protein
MSNLDTDIKIQLDKKLETKLEKLIITKKKKPIEKIAESEIIKDIDKDIEKKTGDEEHKIKTSKHKSKPLDKNTKQKLGQFYTTNQDYILQDMYIPDDVKIIIEPFTGNGDLLNFIKDNKDNANEDTKTKSKEQNKYTLECYDIDRYLKLDIS